MNTVPPTPPSLPADAPVAKRPRRVQREAPPTAKKRLGTWGEDIACLYLEKKGYTLLARNWRLHQVGEMDIITKHGDELVFVEVKTRRPSQVQTGLEALTPRKRVALETVIAAYVQAETIPADAHMRMDWLLIVPNPDGSATVHHSENILEQ
jgi:putative endonuclease